MLQDLAGPKVCIGSVADGSILLRVERVTDVDVLCRVVVGGRLSAHKGLNVPSGLTGFPILGEKDRSDLRFGFTQGVDYVGLSFVRTVEDVHTARGHIGRCARCSGRSSTASDLHLERVETADDA